MNEKKMRKKPFPYSRFLAVLFCTAVIFFAFFAGDIYSISHSYFESVPAEFSDYSKDYSEVLSILNDTRSQNAGFLAMQDEYNSILHTSDGDGVDYSKLGAATDNDTITGKNEFAHIITSDGSYIYTLDAAKKNLEIYSVARELTRKVSHIDLSAAMKMWDGTGCNIIVDGDFLSIIYQKYVGGTDDTLTACITYSVKNREKPKYKNELYQSGKFVSYRAVDGYLYMVSSFMADNPDSSDITTFVPFTGDGSGKNNYMRQKDICAVAGAENQRTYTVIGGFKISAPSCYISQKAVLGGGEHVCISNKFIYVTSDYYEVTDTPAAKISSKLIAFDFDSGEISYGRISGIDGVVTDSDNMIFRGGTLYVFAQKCIYKRDETGTVTADKGTELTVFSDSMDRIARLQVTADETELHAVMFDTTGGCLISHRTYGPYYEIYLDKKNSSVTKKDDIAFSCLSIAQNKTSGAYIGAYDTSHTEKVFKMKLCFYNSGTPSQTISEFILLDSAAVLDRRGAVPLEGGKWGIFGNKTFEIYRIDDTGAVCEATIKSPSDNPIASACYIYNGYLYLVSRSAVYTYEMNNYTLVASAK